MDMILKSFNVHATKYFLLYAAAFVLVGVLGNEILVTDDLYYDFFDQQMSYERITEFLSISKRLTWIVYILIPVYLLLKIFVVATCLAVGVLLFGYNVEFIRLFKIALLSDIVFLVPPILKLVWFITIVPNYDLTDIQFFFPLSAFNLVRPEGIEPWMFYPLQIINIFEIIYWVLLAMGLRTILNASFSKSLAMVLSSYGVSLLLWVTFVIFLTISLQ